MADNKLGPSEVDDETYTSAVFEDGGSLLIDLSNVEEMKFDLIPKGAYDAKIDEVQFGKSKSSGQPMMTFILTIEGGDYAGRKKYFYASFSQKAIKGTKSNLLRIDPNLFSGQFDPQKIVDSGELLGRDIKIKIVHQERTDNGEMQDSVGSILPGSSTAATEGNDGDAFFK